MTDRQAWEAGAPERERQQLHTERDNLTGYTHELGGTPPEVAERITAIDKRLAQLQTGG